MRTMAFSDRLCRIVSLAAPLVALAFLAAEGDMAIEEFGFGATTGNSILF
ncbi:hypothetical protein ACQ86O_16945 [Serratia sp. L9]